MSFYKKTKRLIRLAVNHVYMRILVQFIINEQTKIKGLRGSLKADTVQDVQEQKQQNVFLVICINLNCFRFKAHLILLTT